jgi:hypothetical protein
MSEMQKPVLEYTAPETRQEKIACRPNAFLVEYGTGRVRWKGYVSAERKEEFFRQSIAGDMASFDSTAICAPC